MGKLIYILIFLCMLKNCDYLACQELEDIKPIHTDSKWQHSSPWRMVIGARTTPPPEIMTSVSPVHGTGKHIVSVWHIISECVIEIFKMKYVELKPLIMIWTANTSAMLQDVTSQVPTTEVKASIALLSLKYRKNKTNFKEDSTQQRVNNYSEALATFSDDSCHCISTKHPTQEIESSNLKEADCTNQQKQTNSSIVTVEPRIEISLAQAIRMPQIGMNFPRRRHHQSLHGHSYNERSNQTEPAYLLQSEANPGIDTTHDVKTGNQLKPNKMRSRHSPHEHWFLNATNRKERTNTKQSEHKTEIDPSRLIKKESHKVKIEPNASHNHSLHKHSFWRKFNPANRKVHSNSEQPEERTEIDPSLVIKKESQVVKIEPNESHNQSLYERSFRRKFIVTNRKERPHSEKPEERTEIGPSHGKNTGNQRVKMHKRKRHHNSQHENSFSGKQNVTNQKELANSSKVEARPDIDTSLKKTSGNQTVEMGHKKRKQPRWRLNETLKN